MATQTALVVTEIGKPVTATTRPIPVPKENEVLLKVSAAGLNPIDQKNRDYGIFIKHSLPAILGTDLAGIVEKVGTNVSGVRVGDHIVTQSNSAGGSDYAPLQQYALVGTALTARIPGAISFDEAATLPSCAIAAFIALFHASGLNIPPPFRDVTTDFDYRHTKIAIVGAGSNCGKFGLQFARIANIGTVVAIAAVQGEAELKSLGATHVIDRHLSNAEIQSRVLQIVGNDLVYVFDAVTMDHTIAISLLSNRQKGTVAHLVPGEPDKTTKAEKQAGFESKQVIGSGHMLPDIGIPFWKAVPQWLENGDLKPLGYTVIEGLDANKVNASMDAYRVGKGTKTHVHP
ncbi:hypothetical protein OIDMADRAFT_137786 [Oidiodendron maius Zn]|uniref:Enoyl reductase (ER) domain-containing protein n=1 Tax=Oidiodendron maius (strain Zn) TaxID=913774 RepID=A0A0C3GPS9_OIDMZ|nr:hypothetical protein OIDMADRAFT_137786 [Oidiodendron maius Zn]